MQHSQYSVPQVVVYTAVFGGYDDPQAVENPDPAIDYLFFTEDESVEVPAPWQRRVVPRMLEDPQREARRVKLLPHLFVGEYDVSVWMDANCTLLDLSAASVLDLLGDADLAVPSHPDRACTYEEAEAVLQLQLDAPELVHLQMAWYRSQHYPAHGGLHATMFLVRRHQSAVSRAFSEAWWSDVQRYSKRDQLSFDFVRWKSAARVRSLPFSYADNPVFAWSGKHKVSRGVFPHQAANGKQAVLANGATRRQGNVMVKSVSERVKTELAARGYAQPVEVFSPQECRWLSGALDDRFEQPPVWYKGWAVGNRSFHDAAVDWRILSHVRAVLGEHVVLWGACLVHRKPGEVHPWHSDIESSAPAARTVSVWIGLQGTCEETSLKMAPGSHQFGKTVQEVAAQKGRRRHEIMDEDIDAWVAECGATEAPELVPMRDGEALFFDGRVWHGSNNLSPHLSRTALLLQYASADTPIRMPAIGHCEWPFKFLDAPWPPCLVVSGKDGTGVNRIALPPMLPDAPDGRRLRSGNYHAASSLLAGRVGWNSHHFFRGYTSGLADVICHMSVLHQGKCPHPPYQHPEEEILLVLEGEVEMHHPTWDGHQRFIQRAGGVSYFPAGFYHTLTTVSAEPAKYLMIRWITDPSGETPALGPGVFTIPDFTPENETTSAHGVVGWKNALLFEGATSYLSKLHCHITVMEPGAGYEPHVDGYDVVLVVLEGEVSCFGGVVGAGGVIVCVAGEPHGLKNASTKPARYLAVEFHAGRMMRRRLLEEGVVVD